MSKKALSGSAFSPESDPAFSIADLTTVWITVNIYASDLLFVSEGMDAEITTLSYPDEVFHGKISYIATGLSEVEKVVVKNQLLIYSGLKEEFLN